MHDEDANDNVSDTQNYDCATVNDTITLKGLQDRFLFPNRAPSNDLDEPPDKPAPDSLLVLISGSNSKKPIMIRKASLCWVLSKKKSKIE